jgi:DNA modification methylase
MELLLSLIRTNGGTQPRAEIDDAVATEYFERMLAGDQFPPVVVFHDGTTYWLADGFHRVKAASITGRMTIEADVRQGTLAEAQWYSYSVNASHGLRRTREDARRQVQAALGHSLGAGMSDRQIAEHVGVSPTTVGKIRAAAGLTIQVGQSTTRTGADGRTINTANIGRKPVPFPVANLDDLGVIDVSEIDMPADDGATPAEPPAVVAVEATPATPVDERYADLRAWLTRTFKPDAWLGVLTMNRIPAWMNRDPGYARAARRLIGELQAEHDATVQGIVSDLNARIAPDVRPALPPPPSFPVDVATGNDREEAEPVSVPVVELVVRIAREPRPLPTPTMALGDERRIGDVSLFCADARTMAELIDPGSVQLVVTSPPYNVGIDYASHDDDMEAVDYEDLLCEVFTRSFHALCDGGRIAVVVPFGVGRNPWLPVAPEVARILTDIGFILRGQVVWDKGTSGNRTSWGSWRLPSDPSLRDTTECIIVAHKGQSKLTIPPESLSDDGYSPWLDSERFMALASDHWAVAPESAQRVRHPAPFPVPLVDNLIRFYAYRGAHILDPFAGCGTVGVAAMQLGCRAGLIEIDPVYCQLAIERMEVGNVGE